MNKKKMASQSSFYPNVKPSAGITSWIVLPFAGDMNPPEVDFGTFKNGNRYRGLQREISVKNQYQLSAKVNSSWVGFNSRVFSWNCILDITFK
jgi:hypothetical protein